MIYIGTALFQEAKPFIDRLRLKPDGEGRIKIFKNDEFILTVTGTGITAAASALGYSFGRFSPCGGDVFLNVGVCGGGNIGQAYICNKITSAASGRTIYPSMIYNSRLPEAELISYHRPKKNIPPNTLADMEGFGMAFAATRFFGNDRIFIIKISSDNGSFGELEKDDISRLADRYSKTVLDFCGNVYSDGHKLKEEPCSKEKELIKGLRLTVSEKIIAEKLLKYYRLKGEDSERLLKSFSEPKTKREGREFIEKLRKAVL